MQLVEKGEQDLFILALVLIAFAYFVGASTLLATGGNVVGRLGDIFTGRNPATGLFAPYPR